MPAAGSPNHALPPTTSPPKRTSGADAVYRVPASQSRRALRLAPPAEPIAISMERHQVSHWLARLSWPADQRDDIMVAVSEAVSNAIEHAYLDPPVVVEARGGIKATPDGQRRARSSCAITGAGPAPTDDEHRDRGIGLMRACMDTVTIGQPDDR